MTYVFTAAPFLPLILFTSPEEECGKSAFCTVLLWSVYRPVSSALLSSTGAFRWIDELKGTIILDDVQSFADDPMARTLFNVGFVNSGHPVDMAKIRRADPKSGKNLKFGVHYFKILGGIGKMYRRSRSLRAAVLVPMREHFPMSCKRSLIMH